MIGSLGIPVHLLQKINIRFLLLQDGSDSLQIILHKFLAFRLDLGAPVHKEVLVLAKSRISGVIRKNRKCIPGIQPGVSLPRRYILNRIRPVFPYCQIGDSGRQQKNDRQKHASDNLPYFSLFLHTFPSLLPFCSHLYLFRKDHSCPVDSCQSIHRYRKRILDMSGPYI